MKFARILIALLALAFVGQVHAASLGSVTTGQGSWPTVLAPDINDDFSNLYAAPLLTIGNQSVFSTERAIGAGTCLTGTDNGANSSYLFGITAGCIGTTQIGTDGVASDEIAADSVGLSEMSDDAVGIDELDLVTGNLPVNGYCITYDSGTGGGTIKLIPCPGASGGIGNVVEDTSPTLGGDLEGGSFDFGTAASQADDVFLAEGSVVNWDNGDCTLTQTGNSTAFGGCTLTGPSVDSATSSAVGVSELATPAEVLTGTDTGRAVTPEGAKYIPGQERCVAASDQSTSITTGNNKVVFPAYSVAWTVTSVYAILNTVSSSGAVTVDINEDPDREAAGSGYVGILSTKITIDASELSSASATPPVVSDPALAANSLMSVDIDGAGTGAKGLIVCLVGHPA